MPASRTLDSENPWPGLESFDEGGQSFFYGRTSETTTLLRKVLDSRVSILYGRSGLGKTSILRAGLFPLLRAHNMLPIYIRFDVRAAADPPIHQLQNSVCDEIRTAVPDAPLPTADESLWEFLHRSNLELWSTQNYLLTPVIVIDQFEEVFTLGERMPEYVKKFRDDFGDLAENRIPETVAMRIESEGASALDLKSHNYRLLISLREDFLPDIDAWSRLIPSFSRSRLRLLPMQTSEAMAAVYKPAARLMTTTLALSIVRIIAGEGLTDGRVMVPDIDPAERRGTVDVEPAILSLFCRELNEERKRLRQPHFDLHLVENAKRDILPNFYSSCVDEMPPGVARFIETELITQKGFRNSYAREDAVPSRLTDDQLNALIQARLLRLEERYGAQRIELTHDVLTGVVREQRDQRQAEEDKTALAARLEQERQAIEQAAAQREAELDRQRRVELERRLESEARATHRFRLLSIALVLACVIALTLAVIAIFNWRSATGSAAAAQRASSEAVTARDQADKQRQLAQRRLDLIRDGIGVKQAVVTGDDLRINEILAGGRSSVQLTASKADLNYKDSRGRPIFRFTLSPVASTLPADQGVAAITYRLDDESLSNVLFTTGPDRDFNATYIGWGCLRRVVVLIEYFDPDRAPELTDFNMCTAVGS